MTQKTQKSEERRKQERIARAVDAGRISLGKAATDGLSTRRVLNRMGYGSAWSGYELGPDDNIGEYADDARSGILNEVRALGEQAGADEDCGHWIADELCEQWEANWDRTHGICGECPADADSYDGRHVYEKTYPGQGCPSCRMEARGEVERFRYYSHAATYIINADASGISSEDAADADAVGEEFAARGFDIVDVADDRDFGRPDYGNGLPGEVVTYTAVKQRA